MEQFEIAWQAPEFEYREKGISWYWISMISAVLLLAAAIWQRNFLFGFFVIIAEILVLAWANRKPQTATFVLNEQGLSIGDRLSYVYDELASFSVDRIDEHGDWPTLILTFQRRLRPNLRVHTPKDKFNEIKEALGKTVHETEYEQSLLDTLERLLRF